MGDNVTEKRIYAENSLIHVIETFTISKFCIPAPVHYPISMTLTKSSVEFINYENWNFVRTANFNVIILVACGVNV